MDSNDSSGSESSSPMNVPINYVSMHLGEVIYRCIVGVLAVLINSTVIAIVSSCRQLYYPRHIYWAAVSIVYLLCIVQPFTEIAAVYWKNRFACQMYVLHASVPHTVISIYLLLAAVDRFIAVNHYEWYKKRMTNRIVITLLISVYVITFATITAPFWTGYQLLMACTVNLTHMHRVMIANVTLAVVCIWLHVKIFTSSRAILRRCERSAQNTVVKFKSFSNSGNASVNLQESDNEDGSLPALTKRCKKLSKLEIKAALSLSINVLPMWLCHLPIAVSAIALYWCFYHYEGRDCGTIVQVNVWMKNVYFAHSLYIPCTYVITNHEFHRAFGHSIRRRVVFTPPLSS